MVRTESTKRSPQARRSHIPTSSLFWTAIPSASFLSLSCRVFKAQPSNDGCRRKALRCPSCFGSFDRFVRHSGALHNAGWTHRDIKPSNVIVGDNGHVTLIDLAFATTNKVDHQAYRGTPKYAAPELLSDDPVAGPAADVFALGRLLWEGLTMVETKNENALRAACELVERMVEETPSSRPTAAELTQTLLRMEIDTLSEHVDPHHIRRAA